MINLQACPVSKNADAQQVIGVFEATLHETPADIRQAGINAVLRHVLNRSQLSADTMMCAECRHFYLSPTFDPPEIRRFYSPEMFEATRAEYRKSEAASGRSWAEQHGIRETEQSGLLDEARVFRPRLLRDFVRAALRTGTEPARIIDIGGMDGNLMSAFSGAERIVYDLSPREGGGDGTTRFLRSAEAVEAEPPFDLMIMSHVLEHEPDPARFLQQFLRAVRPGGGAYLEVPLEYQASYVRRRGFPIGGHVNFFTSRSLHRLATDAGLQVLRLRRGVFAYGETRIPILKVYAGKPLGVPADTVRRGVPFVADLAYDLALLALHRYVYRH